MANPLKVLTALSASSGVAVSGSDGLIVQQGGLTVSSGVTSVGALTASSAELTTVDINGGTIDGASIGASSQSSGKFTSISGSSTLQAAGAATLAGGLTVSGGALVANTVDISGSALNITNAAAVGSLLVGGGFGSEGVTITTGGDISADGNITVGGNIVADANENKSIFAAVTSQTITIGASGTQISLPGTASVGGNLTITGDLTVNGTTTTINTTNLVVEDHNIILGAVTTPTDSTADGGGITLSGSTNKTFQWSNSTDSWTSSENLDLASGKTFKVGAVDVVKQTSFSEGVENNSMSVSVTGSQIVSGSSTSFVGVGAGSVAGMGSIGDVAVVKGNVTVVKGGDFGIKIEASGSGMGGVTIGAYGSGETITLTGSAGSVTLSDLVTAVNGGTGVAKANYYSVRQSVVAHNNSGSTNDVIFHFNYNPAVPEGPFNGENWGFHRITGLSGSSESDCLDALGYASIDVVTRDNGATNWTNDLVSVKVEASSSSGTWYPKITVSAPALTKSLNTKIRMIIVNEKSGSIG